VASVLATSEPRAPSSNRERNGHGWRTRELEDKAEDVGANWGGGEQISHLCRHRRLGTPTCRTGCVRDAKFGGGGDNGEKREKREKNGESRGWK